jgi:hypothetical protein
MYEDSPALSSLGHVQHKPFELPEDAFDACIDRLPENGNPMPLVIETLKSFVLLKKLPLLKKLFEEKGADIHYQDDNILGEGVTLLQFAIGCLNVEFGDTGDDASCLEYLLQMGADRTNDDVKYAKYLGKDWAVNILEKSVFKQYHQT